MNWTKAQVELALALYCQLPFGKLHRGTPEIIALAEHLGRTPSSVAMKLNNLASLDPKITGTGRKGLEGASALDRAVWAEFQADWEAHLPQSIHALDVILGRSPESPASPEPEETSQARTVEVRTKQALFRRLVLGNYQSVCCMSGVAEPQLLVASHIVPWHKQANARLNPANGLCLSVLHDKAFDRGLITVLPNLTIVVSTALQQHRSNPLLATQLLALDAQKIRAPDKFLPANDFLQWHNTHVFKH